VCLLAVYFKMGCVQSALNAVQKGVGRGADDPGADDMYVDEPATTVGEIEVVEDDEGFQVYDADEEKASRGRRNKKKTNSGGNERYIPGSSPAPRQNPLKMASQLETPGAATGIKAYSVLQQIFTERLSFVRSMKRAGRIPTVPQLASFLTALVAQIAKALHAGNDQSRNIADPEVQKELVQDFERSMNWSWSTNAPIKGSQPPTPAGVEKFLVNMISMCRTKEAKLHRKLIADAVPSPGELNSLSEAAHRLWILSTDSRLRPGVDYELDVQQGKRAYVPGDTCPRNLIKYIKNDVLQRKTFKTFMALLDNYTAEIGIAEQVTAEERREEDAFIDAVFDTPEMNYVYKYATKKGRHRGSVAAMKKYLGQLWFGLYKRGVRGDSSAFEHVFVGERKHGEVIGMHNWLQIYQEEQKGNFDYLGYIKPKGRYSGNGAPLGYNDASLITFQFTWMNQLKPVSTSFFGVSPEFEFALYSLIYFCGVDGDNEVHLGPYPVNIVCHKFGSGKYAHIGTVYPEAVRLKGDHAATRVQSVYRGNRDRRAGRK
jgi:hypothetical protein